jgi:hypothetical protein
MGNKSYGIVSACNLKDKFLLLHLLTAQPMHAGHGNSTTVWEQMVDKINQEIGPDQQPVFSQTLTVCAAKDCHSFLMKFARKYEGVVLNSTGTDNIPKATEMQQLLEAVLEVTDQKQSKTGVKSVKGNRSYAQKKRDKVDGESVRNDNLATYRIAC